MATDAVRPVRVHVVPHTHWDREWYFTAEQSRVLLGEMLPVVLDELEQGRLPAFVLDGQSVLVEDYLALVPAERGRVAALVRAGKLLVGPWYTQSDQCVVGAESLVRNLLYGTRDARALGGEPLSVGYVPDSFGQTAQLPQILKGFGIERCIFWRGFSERVHPRSEFVWEAPDGSRVIAAAILSGYSGVKGMPDDAAAPGVRLAQLRHHVEYMRPFNAGPNVLLMAGNDQQPWDPRLPGILADENGRQPAIEYLLSTPARFFDAVEAGGALGVVRGEMLAARHGRIHRGIWSTRYDVKKANADAEKLLTLALEPVLAIGWSLGMPYPHGFLERAWKTLLESHAHDSIGGCNSDEVNRAVKQRCRDVLESGQALLELRMRAIAERVRARQDGERVLLFNTLPERRRTLATVQVLAEASDAARLELRDGNGSTCAFQPLAVETLRLGELVQDVAALVPPRKGNTPMFRHRLLVDAGELPALGYTTLYLRARESAASPAFARNAPAGCIENGLLRVRLADDGTLELTELAGGRVFAGLLELVDGGDDGDEYDFSPPRADWKVSTLGARPEAEVTTGPLQQSLRLRYALDVPRDLEERAARRASATLPVDLTLALRADEPFLRVTIALDNTARDHRLQALFRTGLDTDVSYAEQPFGLIERPSRPPELADWERAGWSSKPVPIYPMQGFVALADGTGGLGVLTDGLREYEIDPDDPGTLAVTLFRSVGVMGKPDLLYRPGRLSGMPLPTPEAELPGRLRFRFALAPFAGAPSTLAALARRYLADVPSFHAGAYPRFALNRQAPDLPDACSLAEVGGPLVVSAVKKAEDCEALLIRAFNPYFVPVAPGEVMLRGRPVQPRSARLDEAPASEATSTVPPQGIVTWLLDTIGP